ncbi:MAG: CHRD domain-containing protein [Acidobacteria bacterium]|nr:CHRD domain-containing protein [Acidobacteriota bacterium]
MQRIGMVLGILVLFSAALRGDTTETQYFRTEVSPVNEEPAITGDNSSGQAIIAAVVRRNDSGNIVSGTVYFDVNYTFVGPVTVTGLHVHQGGAGVNGPIRFDTGITDNATVNAEGTGNIFRVVEVTGGTALTALSPLLADPAGFYLNLHTADHTGGLMRGQLQTTAQPEPDVFDNEVVNIASYAAGTNPLAPGSIAAIFGKYLNAGPAAFFTSFGPDGKLITSLGGTQVTVNGIAAPIFYSTFTQVGIQIPSELSGETSASVQVTVGGKTSVSRTIALDAAVPGIFTLNQAGTGPATMLHQNGVSLVTAANPAQPNEVETLFGTGFGATSPALATGAPAVGNEVLNAPTATIDGLTVTPESAGRVPGFIGLDQLRVKIPVNVRSGSGLSLFITSGSRQSNTVTTSVTNGSGTVTHPVPAISSLTPSIVDVGAPGFTLTINGTGFVPASTVMIDDVQRASTYVSDVRLTVQMTADDTSTERTLTVRVQNPAPGGGSSNVSNLTVAPAPPDDPYY